MASFRALQPALMEEKSSPPQSHIRLLSRQRPKRTVTLGACVACRKRKSKCNGSRPVCTCCTQKKTDCVYEIGPNQNPSQAMKRKNEEMQSEVSNLRQLYEFLQSSPEEEAMEMLRRIRANPPNIPLPQRTEELADFLRPDEVSNQKASDRLQAVHQHDYGKSVPLPPLRLVLSSLSMRDTDSLPLPEICAVGVGVLGKQQRSYADGMRDCAR
jgi:hypothetical protein